MKSLIATLILIIAGGIFIDTSLAKDERPGKGEIKKICIDKKGKDGNPVMGKDKKPVQECREIKVRKKLEGTEVPGQKK
jgi:hypothetical protein